MGAQNKALSGYGFFSGSYYLLRRHYHQGRVSGQDYPTVVYIPYTWQEAAPNRVDNKNKLQAFLKFNKEQPLNINHVGNK